jgi:FKBP-type peptidyl-prolyl cis-trans isomerase
MRAMKTKHIFIGTLLSVSLIFGCSESKSEKQDKQATPPNATENTSNVTGNASAEPVAAAGTDQPIAKEEGAEKTDDLSGKRKTMPASARGQEAKPTEAKPTEAKPTEAAANDKANEAKQKEAVPTASSDDCAKGFANMLTQLKNEAARLTSDKSDENAKKQAASFATMQEGLSKNKDRWLEQCQQQPAGTVQCFVTGKSFMDIMDCTRKLQRSGKGKGQEKAAIPAPSDVAAPPKDAGKTPSGLASKVLKAGAGNDHPTADNTVTVHYTGWTTDGKMFDSSVSRGQPISFGLKQVIAGWTEGLQLMVPGEKRRLWIPQDLAYRGRPGAPAGMLVFDVELISFK